MITKRIAIANRINSVGNDKGIANVSAEEDNDSFLSSILMEDFKLVIINYLFIHSFDTCIFGSVLLQLIEIGLQHGIVVSLLSRVSLANRLVEVGCKQEPRKIGEQEKGGYWLNLIKKGKNDCQARDLPNTDPETQSQSLQTKKGWRPEQIEGTVKTPQEHGEFGCRSGIIDFSSRHSDATVQCRPDGAKDSIGGRPRGQVYLPIPGRSGFCHKGCRQGTSHHMTYTPPSRRRKQNRKVCLFSWDVTICCLLW
jgi:hypothetical protein